MPKNNLIIFLLTALLVCLYPLSAQENLAPGQLTSTDKKAVKLFQEAKRMYDSRQDDKAEDLLLKAIKVDKNFMEPHMLLAAIYVQQGKIKERAYHLEQAITVGPNMYVENYFFLAETEFRLNDLEKAKGHYQQFLKFPRLHPDEKEQAEFKLKCTEFSIEARKHPKNIQFKNMGASVNSEDFEYFPTITADEHNFYFTRRLPCPECMGKWQEDLFLTKGTAESWAPAAVVRELSSQGNEGAPTISADGNYMFMTISQEMGGAYMGGQAQGYGSCDIFYTQKVNGRWTKPVNLGPKINSAQWESQPSFSSDGKTLYFVRGNPLRTGSVKNIDIYYSVVEADGKFSQAVKLPENINSKDEEESVFIHPDNQTLYFSSRGHVGLGGADIFISRRQADGTWGDPVNLGFPLNSADDENSLLVSPSGRKGYFASDRQGGMGGLDIYEFDVPADMRPQPLTYVKGIVYNARTRQPLDASFELIDLDSQKSLTRSYSQKNGEFLVTLTASKNYMVNVSREGYLFYSDNFFLKDVATDFSKPFLLDIPLEPIDTGSVVELKNIFFDVNKSELKPESKNELDKLVSFLTKNANLKIELGGHTDNTGDKKANQILSENRAKAVADYLINTGKISAARLSFKGYGDTRPKVANDTPENKAKNRRTEFKVTGK
jgi:outer membrane protein OmpA-like peptidoglycan-associated protein/tetratricopeptide (TPR) repeat protein